jgi:hypothetical protein
MSTLILALVPAIVLSLAFISYCLNDLTHSEVRLLPRWAWVIVIIASLPFGGILYLAAGKKHT